MNPTLKKMLATVLPAAKKTPPPTAEPDAPKKPGPDPAASEELLVWSVPTLNRTLIVAYKRGTDPTNPNNLRAVRVRANYNFIQHQKLRVRLVEGTIYDLVGPLPRWRGRY